MINRAPIQRGGFTLLELMLALSVLVVITAIVYAIFASVTRSIDFSEASIEELRLRQFLTKSFETNFAAAYADRQYEDPLYRFVGEPNDGYDGARDSVRFCATTPLIGGMAMPGDLKEVRYQILDERGSAMTLSWDDSDGTLESDSLQMIETPLLAGGVDSIDESSNLFVPDESYESPSWAVPIRSVRFDYFDGTDWVREWDSHEIGRMPWAVRVRVNFAKAEEMLEQERRQNFSLLDDPDFEVIVPIPSGMRVEYDVRLEQDPFEEEGDLLGPDEDEPEDPGEEN